MCVDTEWFLCSREIKGGRGVSESRGEGQLPPIRLHIHKVLWLLESVLSLSVIGRRVANPAASEGFNNSIIRP